MGIVILDGAMGTELQKAGLKPGEVPELWNLTEAEKVIAIHSAYLEAGTQLICTNTFGANARKMYRTGHSVQELISAAVANARTAVARSKKEAKVALDLGPIGALIAPLGDLSFEKAYELFAEEVEAGKDADIIFIETMTDLYEMKAACLAAKEHAKLPVFASMSFEANGRTFTGTSLASMAMTLEGLGVDAIGFNCSLGPAELAPLVKELYTLTSLPIFFKPNAGLPDPMTNQYNVTPEEFAGIIRGLLPYGIAYLGGCCGTSPEYIRAVTQMLDDVEKEKAAGTYQLPEDFEVLTERKIHRAGGICSAQRAVFLTEPRVIGERINPTGKKRFKEALQKDDMDYILEQALAQVDAGAEILDVNVGLPGIDEKTMMCKVIRAIQAVVDVPLQIDSNNPEVIEAALRIYNGKPIVNSVNGEAKSRAAILPLVKRYGAAVVGLTLDEAGICKHANERFAIAEKILTSAKQEGIPETDIYIDCLTLTASAEQETVYETLEAVRMVHDRLGLNCVLGVSNISFGLPNRDTVNTAFLTMALQNGLTLPIMNPNSESMMGAVRAYRLLMNYDKNCSAYTEIYKDFVPSGSMVKKEGSVSTISPKNGLNETENDLTVDMIRNSYGDNAAKLYLAVVRGLASEGEKLTEELLATMEAMELVNGVMIPALDTVGAGYEKGRIYLPQLILSAAVVQGAFAKIKEHLARIGAVAESKGTVVLATVKGDIHDIGKNIVKVLLENYGFTVIDLGKDVEPEAVVAAAKEHEVKLVGLSALMTTTLGSMEETIWLLKRAALPCKVVVGGAVLTGDYAEKMHADFYARDAKETVDIARRVYGV